MNLRSIVRAALVTASITLGACAQGTIETSASNAITIAQEGAPFTVINRLSPSAEDHNEMLAALKTGIAEEMSVLDGFIAAAIHESADSDDVIVYAQWQSGEALSRAAAKVQAGEAPNMDRAYQLGSPEYHPFKVVAVFTAVAKP